jgi:hypothetical protein
VRRDGTTGKLDSSNYARSNCAIGRRPQGLELAQLPRDCAPLATFLANAAQLEAASVSAFARLGHELQQLGAAPSLLAATRRSAGDEVRHAQLTATLARSYGGTVRAPHVTAPAASRGAFEIALENAVEGCVRETFGALIAWHQAAFARDPSVAAIMRGIAADETRHAELSWKIAQWLEPQLSEGERRLLAAAREQAVRQLECEIRADTLPAPAREQIGMPTQAVQRALTDRMAATLGLS